VAASPVTAAVTAAVAMAVIATAATTIAPMRTVERFMATIVPVPVITPG
jgi:hypothetical protein